MTLNITLNILLIKLSPATIYPSFDIVANPLNFFELFQLLNII